MNFKDPAELPEIERDWVTISPLVDTSLFRELLETAWIFLLVLTWSFTITVLLMELVS